MLKDIIIALLAGIAVAQQATQPGDPARGAVMLIAAVMAFMAVLEAEELWDRRMRIQQQAGTITGAAARGLRSILHRVQSRIRWWKIRLRAWPAEKAMQRRRRRMLVEYIQQLRELRLQERQKQIEEAE